MIVSYEIAKLLAEKGFEQPPYKTGQFWYINQNFEKHKLGDVVLVGSFGIGSSENLRKVFAPTVTDILPFVGCFLEYDFVMQKFGIGFDGLINFFDNPAEGLALFWLNSAS